MLQLSEIGVPHGEGLSFPCHKAVAARLRRRQLISPATGPAQGPPLNSIPLNSPEGLEEFKHSQHQLSSAQSLMSRVFYAWMALTFYVVTPDQSSLKQGTTLLQHVDVWDQLFPKSWASERVRHGFEISAPDNVRQDSIPPEVNEKQRRLLRPLKEDQIRKGICQIIPGKPVPTQGTFYLKSFPVPKSTPGKFRDCIDGRPLNAQTAPVHFKGEGIDQLVEAINPGDWAVTSDWEGWYNHAILTNRSKRLSRTILDGQIIQYNSVTFGLHEAPYWLQSLTKPVFGLLRSLGLRFGGQVDDWAWLDDSFLASMACGQLAISVFCMLGCILNSKTVLIPRQRFTHLGGFFNTRVHCAFLTRARVLRIRTKCNTILALAAQHKEVHIKQLASLAGQLAQARLLLFLHRLQSSEIRQLVAEMSASKGWECLVEVPPHLISVLVWWQQNVLAENGMVIRNPAASMTIVKDASQWGWGAHVMETGQTTFGFWNSTIAGSHSTETEVRADIVAAKALIRSNDLRNMQICIRSDATTSVSYINRQGGSKRYLNSLVVDFLLWCWRERRITFSAAHIAGVDNTIADSLSRTTNAWTELELAPWAFSLICQRWGNHTLDLCASSVNNKVRRFVSWRPDPEAWAVDALTLNLQSETNVYAFPPDPIVARILRVLTQNPHLVSTLVTPFWTAQHWFPLVMRQSVDLPMLLPPHAINLPPVLVSLGHQRPRWNWIVWRICGNVQRQKAFNQQVSSYCSMHGKVAAVATMTSTSDDGLVTGPVSDSLMRILQAWTC
jgi:hypothetical protein